MSSRTAIELDGFAHANPVPAASRVGPLLMSGVLPGRDPVTGELPVSLAEQLRNVFALIGDVMRAAGGTTDDIVKITFHLVDFRDRDALNAEWVRLFPDRATMPARQVIAARLDGGALVHADLVAWMDPRRT